MTRETEAEKKASRILIFFGFMMCIAPIWWFVVPNLHRMHPLYKAIVSGDVETVKKRITRNPSEVEFVFFGLGAKPLHLAAERGDTEMIDLLLSYGADIESLGYRNECPPLHCAALHGQNDAVLLLLERGSDVNSYDRDKETPLHKAAYRGHSDTIRLLIRHGANIHARSTSYDRSPLDEAVRTIIRRRLTSCVNKVPKRTTDKWENELIVFSLCGMLGFYSHLTIRQ